MSEPRDDLEARLRGLTPPPLPAGLKERVMEAAELAPVVSRTDRIWYSSAWRLAAAGALLAILAGDRWSATTFGPDLPAITPFSVEERKAVVGAGEEMGLPVEAITQLTARMDFVPLTAREPADQAGAALR